MQPPPGGWPPPPPGYPPPPHGYPQQGYPQQGPPSQGYGYGPAPGYAPIAPVPAAAMYRCPICADTSMPLEREKVSTVGWVLFAVLLLCCLPLCVIGLLQKEKYRVCARCNHQLGKIG